MSNLPSVVVILSLSFCLRLQSADLPIKTFNVRDFGASGDGKADDRLALQKALDAAANAGGGEVDFPAGTFLTGSLVVKSRVTLNLAKDAVILGSPDPDQYPIAPARWEGLEHPCHQALIHADHAEDISIVGSGTIQGDSTVGALRNPRGPTLIEPVECKNFSVSGVTLRNTRMWILHPTYCQNVSVLGVAFEGKEVNSDGIDPDSCQHVTIDRCRFFTGDDNIAIKSGKGEEGVKMARPCEDIIITNCAFVKGTCSIAFGSELSGGIRGVHISHCTFENGRAALYLKSRPGRGGYVRDVTAEHLVVGPEPLLEIDTDYRFNPDAQEVIGADGITSFSNIQVSDVKADAKSLVKIQATPDKPVVDVSLSNFTGRCQRGFLIRNAAGVDLRDIKLDGLSGPLLFVDNVQGKGLDGAVAAETPAPDPHP